MPSPSSQLPTAYKPVYRPQQNPVEPDSLDALENYPTETNVPVTGTFPRFPVAQIIVTRPGEPIPLLDALVYRDDLVAMEAFANDFDYTDPVSGVVPIDFDSMLPQCIPVTDTDRSITIQVRDYADRHPALQSPYEVILEIEYVEANADIENLLDEAGQQRAYRDLIESGVRMFSVETDNYCNDPTYSALPELSNRLNDLARNQFDRKPPIPEPFV